MASVTRSRRAEGLNPYSHPLQLGATRTRGRHNTSTTGFRPSLPSVAPAALPKRQRDESDRETDTLRSPKRPLLTINLSSSPNAGLQHKSNIIPDPPRPRPGLRVAPAIPDKRRPVAQQQQQQQPPALQKHLHAQQQQRQPHNHTLQQRRKEQPPSPPPPLPQSKSVPPSKPTAPAKTQPRPRNAVKRELGSLQVDQSTPKAAEGRKLRSQEATRFKSDLAAYFPDYDEVIGNDPKPDHLLDLKTPVIVVDPTPPPSVPHRQPPRATREHGSGAERQYYEYPVRSYGDNLFTDLFESQEISFGFLQVHNSKSDDAQDPLPDSYFEPAHRKAERAEKSIRNSERGRAQHEKEQIIRLLDGLQGHDWLRTMGVSGITESKKKEFEGPRRHFIRGCEAILEKFRQWGVEEKRRKLEKDRALAAAARLNNGHDPEGETHAAGGSEEERSEASGVAEMVTDTDAEPPYYSDVDASIAKQLRDEAKARSTAALKKPARRPRRQQEPVPPPPPPPEPVPPKPFTSFFDKKYLRDAALNRTRRKGRTVLAWGHAVPDMAEADFNIPPEFLDEKTLRSNARRKRRDKRGSKR